MAAKKRAKKPPRRPVTAALARRPAPAVRVEPEAEGGAESVYVRVPLAPEVVIALREHASNASRLLELVTGTEATAADVFKAIADTAAALERDVQKARARLRSRRR